VKKAPNKTALLEVACAFSDIIDSMIDRGFQKTTRRSKSLGNESVHGLPLDWPEQKRSAVMKAQAKRQSWLATQNVHGLPTIWGEMDLSE
jgi:hypothetical protein